MKTTGNRELDAVLAQRKQLGPHDRHRLTRIVTVLETGTAEVQQATDLLRKLIEELKERKKEDQGV